MEGRKSVIHGHLPWVHAREDGLKCIVFSSWVDAVLTLLTDVSSHICRAQCRASIIKQLLYEEGKRCTPWNPKGQPLFYRICRNYCKSFYYVHMVIHLWN